MFNPNLTILTMLMNLKNVLYELNKEDFVPYTFLSKPWKIFCEHWVRRNELGEIPYHFLYPRGSSIVVRLLNSIPFVNRMYLESTYRLPD